MTYFQCFGPKILGYKDNSFLFKKQSKASHIGKRRVDIVIQYLTLFPVIMVMMYWIRPI